MNLDSVLSDLGKRILARDFFKIVPCEPTKTADFLQDEGAYEKLHNVIKSFCPGDKEFYLVKDDIDINIFSDIQKEIGYFVDENNVATPFRDLPELRSLSFKNNKVVRLFTIREAIDAVCKLINSQS